MKVQKGEALLEVESDKVNVEIEAPEDGLLGEITVQEDDFANSAPWLRLSIKQVELFSHPTVNQAIWVAFPTLMG